MRVRTRCTGTRDECPTQRLRARAPCQSRDGPGGDDPLVTAPMCGLGASRCGPVRLRRTQPCAGQDPSETRPRAGTASAKASRQGRIGSPDGSGVGSRTAQAGGVEARGQVEPGTSTTSTSMPRRAEDLAGPVGAGRAAAVDQVVDRRACRRPGDRVRADQLDDRLGEIRRVGGHADLVARPPAAASPRPRPERGGGDLGREVVAGRAVQPGRADDPEAAARAVGLERRVARRSASALAAPYGLIGFRSSSGRVADAVGPRGRRRPRSSR